LIVAHFEWPDITIPLLMTCGPVQAMQFLAWPRAPLAAHPVAGIRPAETCEPSADAALLTRR